MLNVRSLLALILPTLALAAGPHNARAENDESLRQRLKEEFARPHVIPYPENNPYSKAKESLGKTLFFDPRLSEKKNLSCASCHHPGLGWEIGMSRPIGAQEMPVKSPTVQNLAWSENYFWDGRAETLEQQFLAAMSGAKALNLPHDVMVERVRAVPGYAPLFAKAFPGREIDKETIAEAVATYERGIVTGPTAFDRWLGGKRDALSPSAKAGLRLFVGKANCVACHSGWNFTDSGFHDIGMDDENIGRAKVLNSPVMQHAFKTPGLREISARAPYTHTGLVASLRDLINMYDAGGELAQHGKPRRENQAAEVKPLNLSEREKEELLAFLLSLNAEEKPVTIPRMPR